MPISMSLKAHYVTQSSLYGTQILGPLTNRKISKYQKLGRYSDDGAAKLPRPKPKPRKKVNHDWFKLLTQ